MLCYVYLQMCSFLLLCEGVLTSDLNLLLRPLIQIDRFDPGDVDPEVSMNTSAADTDEDA